MDGMSELVWTLAAIGTMDALFVLWLAARAARRGRSSNVISSAEVLGSRARRSRV